MKPQTTLALAGLAAAIGICSLSMPAHAQRGRGGRGGFGGAAGFPGGGMQAMMGMGNIIDPAQSAKLTLVYRIDVQNALGLDLKQKLALDALKDIQAQNQQKMGSDMRTLFQGMRAQRRNQTPEERQAARQDMQDKVKGIAQGYQDDIDKRIDEILTPRQRTRLSQLDLRWRGPLALVDSKVADRVMLGTDDVKKAKDAYTEFTTARQQLVMSMLPAGIRNRIAARASGGTGATAANPTAAPAAPAQPLSPDEQAAAQKKAIRDFDKSRVAMGTRLLGTVSPSASAAWQTLIGAPFTFRDLDN